MKFMASNQQSLPEDRTAYAAILPFYYEVCCKLDAITASAEFTAQEALNSSIFGRMFVAIADTFTGLLNTFKTNIFKFNKSIKRSELREYVESNRMKVSTVEGLPFEKVADFAVDVPARLAVTFKQAIDNVATIEQQINAHSRAKVSNDAITTIYKAASTDDAAMLTSAMQSFIKVTTPVLEKVKPYVLECQKNFSDQHSMKKVYKTVYSDTAEFAACKDSLLGIEKYLQEIHEIKGMIENIEKMLKGTAQIIENGDFNLEQKLLVDFGEALKSLALLFDSTQLAATRQLTLEHNHILNYNNIFAKVR